MEELENYVVNSKLQPISRSGQKRRFCCFETPSHGSAKEMELTYTFQAEKDFIQGIGLQLVKGLEEQIQIRGYRKDDGHSPSVCSSAPLLCIQSPQGSWLAAAVTAGACVLALCRNPLLLLQPKANGFCHPILAKCPSLKESKPKILLAKESEKCCFQASSPYGRVRALEK